MRSINSPGVEILETDQSQYITFGGGTNVFVPGFASQGPTDEVLLVTSISELEQIYGVPQTAAEKYFYYTSREILNAQGNLLTSRLPYGSGSGAGFANQYSALLYPVASATDGNGFIVGQPTHITFDESVYYDMLENNFTWGPNALTNSLTASTISQVVSTELVVNTLSAARQAQLNAYVSGLGRVLTTQFTGNSALFTFVANVTTTSVVPASASYNADTKTLNAGIVVLNSAQVATNEFYEGYYIALTDNKDIKEGSDFTSVNSMYALSSTSGKAGTGELLRDGYVTVAKSRLGFALSATSVTEGTKSVSETIEFIPTFNFGLSSYQDSLILSLFKVNNSIYEPDTLVYSLVESYTGSLNSRRLDELNTSSFLQTRVNNRSKNIRLLVNPDISTKTDWSTLGAQTTPNKYVRTAEPAKALYTTGVFTPTYLNYTNKEIGDVSKKLDRVLSLISTTETLPIDIVVDGGLSTISATTTLSSTNYDDLAYINTEDLNIETSPQVSRWQNIFNTFNNFVETTRKDCVFIADPIKQIFVNGNVKTLSKRGNNFTQHIYSPLKNLLRGVNSNYSVIYGNWVKVDDLFSDVFVWVPASGFAARAMIETDRDAQPWVAPAGLNRGILNNVVDIAFNPNQKQRDYLYTISINPIVFFNGDGFVLYGQKTLQQRPSAFDRINVRRLFLTLERAVQETLRFFVFEPNTDFTRTRLRNTITPVFELAKNTQGVYDYLIVCDERNNTPDVIDRNELAVDIYIKPVKAAEFILVNFIATRTGQSFQELI